MGRFADEAKQAAAATDEKLSEELKELETKDLSSCFPNPVDKKLMEQLAVEIKKSTDKNETITACQAIAVNYLLRVLKHLRKDSKLLRN